MLDSPMPTFRGVIRSGYELARDLRPGYAAHGIGDGSWSLIQAIRGVLERTGPANLVVATWTANRADIAEAHQFLSDGRVRDLRLIVDRSFATRQPAYCAAARERFGDDAIRVASVHCKFTLVLDGEFDVLLLTSANLNRNRRMENYSVFAGGDLPREYARMVDALFGAQESGEGFDRPACARRHTDAMYPR